MITPDLASRDSATTLAPYEQAVNSAEARVRIVWVTLVSLSAYVLVAFLATSHEDLLLQSRQKLPLLQVELPLTAFAFIGPAMLLLVHVATLVNVLYIKDALGDYCAALRSISSHRARSASASRLASGIFVRGPGLPVPGLLRGAQWTLETVTVWLAPPLIILFCQLRFMPYHDLTITWVHRAILSLDLLCVVLAAVAAPRYLHKKIAWTPARKIASWLMLIPGAALFAGIGFASFLVLQHRQDEWWNPLPRCDQRPCPIALLFESKPAPWLHRDIFAPATQAVTQPADKLAEGTFSISLRGRDLEGANLEGGRFFRADFRGANLRRANLRDADLREALFGCFLFQADRQCSILQFADLSDAFMQGADFNSAIAQGAVFSSWESHGAQLQRADFSFAKLAGAVFYGDLSGAIFRNADLAGAHFLGSYLAGANFYSANLAYAELKDANLSGAIFDGAALDGADLRNASLWRSTNIREPEENEPAAALDCRGAKAGKLTAVQYQDFLKNVHQVTATLDRPHYTYPYLDPENGQPSTDDGKPIPDLPTWLDECKDYDPSRQDAKLARLVADQLCAKPENDFGDTDVNKAAMWPKHNFVGRFMFLPDFEQPERKFLISEFYQRIFNDDGCARMFARVRAMSPATVPDRFFATIAEAARSLGVSEDQITKTLGPVPASK
jgi:uncharacterized protein YjbI with pentapeptide repeats